MWFLRDESGEKVSDFFPSQAKLAVHMQMTPQTLQRAIKKGKNVFQFRGQEVKVVQETIPQFAVFDFPPSERSGNPIETFEMVSEVAKWLKVPNQTVYAAVKRGDETKVKNKEGAVFWLKRLETESECSAPVLPQPLSRPVPLPRKKVPQPPVPLPRKIPPPIPPVPLPRKKVPQPSPVSPPQLPPPQASPKGAAKPPPIPPEVAEVIRAGKTFPFETSKKLEVTTFLSAARLARFIKSGCGKMFVQGPKKHQMFICNEKSVFLPDLVREIIVFHIRDQMWKDEDGAGAFVEKVCEYNFSLNDKTTKNWIQGGFLARVRRLDDETIEQICKEFMKMF